MRSVLFFVMFGMLLLLPGLSPAETTAECQTRCSTEMTSAIPNCPEPGDEGRGKCLQDIQVSYRHCIESCPQAPPADTPKDAPAETPPADTPKEN